MFPHDLKFLHDNSTNCAAQTSVYKHSSDSMLYRALLGKK